MNQKRTGRASSMPVGLLWGAGTSLGITLAGTAVTSKLLCSETMEEAATGYAVMVMLMLGAFAGAMIARSRIKRQYLAVCLMSGGIYFLILLSITALFFGGQYEAVGVTACLVFGGSLLAVLTGKRSGKAGKGGRKRIGNR